MSLHHRLFLFAGKEHHEFNTEAGLHTVHQRLEFRAMQTICIKKIFYCTIADLPTHALVQFDCDGCYCVVLAKRVSGTLTPGENCVVKWTQKKTYGAVVLASGK